MKIKGSWIRSELLVRDRFGQAPAPYYRKKFTLEKKPEKAILHLCTPCWHELYVNGKKIGNDVLTPVVMQLDKHIPALTFDLTKLLHKGENEIKVLLGHGWYAMLEQDVWNFNSSPWQPKIWDSERLLAELRIDGRTKLATDTSWEYTFSPILYNTLRNGEVYDARVEDEKEVWANVVFALPPPGVPEEETVDQCRICDSFKPVSVKKISKTKSVYDFGKNLTGHAKIAVKGKAGAEVVIRYSERINPDGTINTDDIKKFVLHGDFQTDRYILAGREKGEEWEARFTYHGFRYAEVELIGSVKLSGITAQFVHSDFETIGSFKCDNEDLNRLFEVTRQSYLCNFTGIPTDCPHREKNGWTGDAQLATETGLWNYSARKAYEHFTQMAADTQTAAGGISVITPNPGFGNGLNPPWDVVIFEIPYELRRFYGDKKIVKRFLPAMEKYASLLATLGDLPRIGLGDWCSSADNTRPVRGLVSSAYFIWINRFLYEVTKEKRYKVQAERSTKAFVKEYRRKDGSWLNGEMTPSTVALYFDLSPEPEKDLKYLLKLVRKNSHKMLAGIIGAKFLPRLLAEKGFIDDALELFIQKEFPGWNYMLKQGATTLWETWDGSASQDHIMFGDIAAWVYQYLGGINPDKINGFKSFTIKPLIPEKLSFVSCSHKSPFGLVKSEWKKSPDKKKISFAFTIPSGTEATVILPDGKERKLTKSKTFTLPL